MKTDLSKFKLIFDLDDVVRQFDCIAGVAYQNNENEAQLLVPQTTMAKCHFVDCKVYDKATMKTDNLAMPYSTADLGQPVGYFPPDKAADIVDVKHWDAYADPEIVDTHKFEIDDQRESNGQAFITIAANEGDLDDMLSITMEVNVNPVTGIEHVPCAHVHFDDSEIAMSLFKIGNKILFRPESNVTIERFTTNVAGSKEEMFWIDRTV